MRSTIFASDMQSDELAVPKTERRGRGAGANPSSRYDISRYRVHDGWETDPDIIPLRTEVTTERARSIIIRNTSPDLGFDRSINPYRGCEHGCVYCYARPSHSYLGLSAGLDFESRLITKPNAAELLKRELSVPGYKPKAIAIGTNTDPYQPIERKYQLTRQILEVLVQARHPVTITTKSSLVLRDLDLLTHLAKDGLVKVFLSVTTLDRKVARSMEPRAPTPGRRLDAIQTLSAAGIPTGVMVAPVVPGLTDHETEAILNASQAAGATDAGYILLRLPLEVAPLFRDWLMREHPGRYHHVMSLVRSMRNGKDYDSDFASRMKGEGPYAKILAMRFQLHCKRLGLERRNLRLRTDLFEPPMPRAKQLSLL